MATARRVNIERQDDDVFAADAPNAREKIHSSGIRAKEYPPAVAVLDVHVPPLDPLPRIWSDEGEEDEPSRHTERLVVAAPCTVTSASGTLIAITPTPRSVEVLSARPPRSTPTSEVRALRPIPGRVETDLRSWAIDAVILGATLAALIALVRLLVLTLP